MPSAAPTPAVAQLDNAGVLHRLHPYELDDGAGTETYGESVAAVLGVDPARLFKTLVAEVDERPCVAIVPVSTRLSTKALARAAGGKRAALAGPDAAERLTGYVTGGISPFGRRRRLPVFVDETIELHPTVFVSAGRRGLQVEIAPADLVGLLEAAVADLTE